MPKRPSKLKSPRRAGEPSGSGGGGRADLKRKASPASNGHRPNTKRDATARTRKPKSVPGGEPPSEPAANVSSPVAQPSPAVLDLAPDAVQQQRAGELLDKLLKLAFDYQWLTFDDMELHRKASQPSLGYTAAILRGIVRASDRGDHAWLAEQAQRANRYLRAHRHEPVPPGAKLVSTWSVFNRPEAASHLKRFVMRKLEEFSRDGRWSYDVSSTVSRDIAEVMVGNLLGGVDELAWQFLPDLRRDLVDDTSTRARVASAIERILHGTSSNIEGTAEAIVRGVLSELGYKQTKALFDFERKAE